MPTVRTDQRAYSRSTSDADQIRVTIAGLTTTDPLTVALVRLDGFGDVAHTTVTPTDATATVTLDLNGPDARIDGMTYIRTGRYRIEVRTGAGTVLAQSAPFPIGPLPVATFQQTYLFGIPLYAEQMLIPVVQPDIPGVRVTYVDPGMLKGPGALAFDATAQTITWRGGPAAALPEGDDVATLQVLTPEGDAYMELEIDPYLLPDVDASSALLIDTWRLRASDLQRYLDTAYTWVEQKLQIRLETTVLTTDPDAPQSRNGWYDVVATPMDYLRGEERSIDLLDSRAGPLQRVLALSGWYAGQQAIIIPPQWITFEPKNAHISIVPVAGTHAAITPTWAAWGASLRAQRLVANYWHYTVISGLPDLRNERATIIEAIGKKAALDVLTDLSLAATGGRTSRSASRDGVSESWNYGGQGAYGEKIQAYSQWLDTQIPKLRQYHRGLGGVTL